MKPLLICAALGLSLPALAQESPTRQREISYAMVVGHVEAAADLCMAPAAAYRSEVATARAQLPVVFRRAKLSPEGIEASIASGRLEVAGWMPALDCALEFSKVVRNLTNWTAASRGWPPPRE